MTEGDYVKAQNYAWAMTIVDLLRNIDTPPGSAARELHDKALLSAVGLRDWASTELPEMEE